MNISRLVFQTSHHLFPRFLVRKNTWVWKWWANNTHMAYFLLNHFTRHSQSKCKCQIVLLYFIYIHSRGRWFYLRLTSIQAKYKAEQLMDQLGRCSRALKKNLTVLGFELTSVWSLVQILHHWVRAYEKRLSLWGVSDGKKVIVHIWKLSWEMYFRKNVLTLGVALCFGLLRFCSVMHSSSRLVYFCCIRGN